MLILETDPGGLGTHPVRVATLPVVDHNDAVFQLLRDPILVPGTNTNKLILPYHKSIR